MQAADLDNIQRRCHSKDIAVFLLHHLLPETNAQPCFHLLSESLHILAFYVHDQPARLQQGLGSRRMKPNALLINFLDGPGKSCSEDFWAFKSILMTHSIRLATHVDMWLLELHVC
eukprot:140675-Pleurochrysis_carterae.AAC.1